MTRLPLAAGLACSAVGAGPPLVLLHAFPLASGMWRPQLDALAEVARVLLPDAPGLGESPVPAGGWTVDGFADAVAAALPAWGVSGPVVVGGLSMGGYVALAFARRHPDKLRGLFLADTKADPDGPDARAGRDKLAAAAREKGPAAVLDTLLPKLLAARTPRDRPGVVAEVRRLASAQTGDGLAAALIALRDRPDANPGLAAVRVPTLVVVGAEDGITPPEAARAMTGAIPGAFQVDILGAGHLSSLEAPTEFNAAVRAFLFTLPAAPGA